MLKCQVHLFFFGHRTCITKIEEGNQNAPVVAKSSAALPRLQLWVWILLYVFEYNSMFSESCQYTICKKTKIFMVVVFIRWEILYIREFFLNEFCPMYRCSAVAAFHSLKMIMNMGNLEQKQFSLPLSLIWSKYLKRHIIHSNVSFKHHHH